MNELLSDVKRILVIGGEGYSLINFRLPLLQAMVDKGYEVHAIATGDEETARKLQGAGIFFHKVPLSRHSLSPLNDLIYFIRLYKKIKKIRPAICLAYTIKPVSYGIIAATLSGVKNRYALITGLGYVFISNDMKAKAVKCIVRFFYRAAFYFSQGVIFQNSDDQECCVKTKLVKQENTYVVNGSGIDLNYFKPGPFPEKLTFLMIARFLPEKGIFEYLEACALLKKQHPEVRCCLVGYIDNPLSGITNTTIETWQAHGIECLGRQDDVRNVLSETSVYVLPSYREGTPRSVLEAMAMGRPIITTDTPGCRQTVEEGKNGFLVPIKNSEALYQAMLRFVNNPLLIYAMGKASLAMARVKFDVIKINKDMLTIMKLI